MTTDRSTWRRNRIGPAARLLGMPAPDPELGIDASRTAYALHNAVDRARRRQPYRPVGWASYVHFGP